MAGRTSDAARMQMINGQLRPNDVNDLDLLAAFQAVPRERFVAPGQTSLAYTDAEPLAAGPKGRRMLSPRTLGLLLKTAAPKRGERALTVGGGAGYTAAVLAQLGLQVTALETDAAAARAANPEGVVCVEGPLTQPPAGGPFDVIVIEGAFAAPPEQLIGALKEGGRLVGVSALRGAKRVALFECIAGGISARESYDAAGEILAEFTKPQEFVF